MSSLISSHDPHQSIYNPTKQYSKNLQLNNTTTTFKMMPRAVLLVLQAAAMATAMSLADVATLSRADVTQQEAEALCGAMGVMEVPEGVDPSEVRVCKEHPDTDDSNVLKKRQCWHGKDVGCSNSGWCYKSCKGGHGAWCWSTVGSPWGNWKSCRRDWDCAKHDPCSGGNCAACGCGC